MGELDSEVTPERFLSLDDRRLRAIGFSGQGGTLYTILVAIGGAIALTLIYRLIVGDRGNRTSGTGTGGFRRAA